MDRVLCYLTGCPCSLSFSDVVQAPAATSASEVKYGTDKKSGSPSATSVALFAINQSEPDHGSNAGVQADYAADTHCRRTKLKSEAAAFQPIQAEGRMAATPTVQADTRMDTVARDAYLTLASCGQTYDVKLQKGAASSCSCAISAVLQHGCGTASRCYEVMQLVKQALEAITEKLPTVALLSSRIQKEECGYSLRSNIACLPEGAEDHMCWDLFNQGHCPRRSQCRWYHPKDADIRRIKVSVRYVEEAVAAASEELLERVSPPEKHKISLGELV